jgi:3-deoxy-7-phosphoheptulonate synthase
VIAITSRHSCRSEEKSLEKIMHKTDELRTARIDSLVTPQELAEKLPISAEIADNVTASRQRIEKILTGEDRRLLVVIGPCSIHDLDAAVDYAGRLNQLRIRYQDRLEIVMRTYFEKPRTVVGWKGLISDPALDGSFQVNRGIEMARRLLLEVNQLGLPTATEFLDMVVGQYIADLISWGAIGARTTESQIHREMASALSCPVGFKNGTDATTRIAIDAIRATDLVAACDSLREFDLPEHLVIDFSHGNCQKLHRRQLEVAENVCQQIRAGSAAVTGVMAESFLVEGTQKIVAGQPLTYGQSITDPCLSWADSEQLLAMLADAVDTRF